MTTTINISLPNKLYKAAKKLVAEEKYSSISEVVRAGIRRVLYDADKITENGFPGWFEDKVLESADEPRKNDIVLESEEDVKNYFKHLKTPKKQKNIKMAYGKNKTWSGLRPNVQGFSTR